MKIDAKHFDGYNIIGCSQNIKFFKNLFCSLPFSTMDQKNNSGKYSEHTFEAEQKSKSLWRQ